MKRTFYITFKVEGSYTAMVEADNIEEAKKLADEEFGEANLNEMEVVEGAIIRIEEDKETEVPHSKYEDKAKRLIEKEFYSIPQVLGFIHGLYQNYEIDEDEEEHLYGVIDPEEKYNEPTEYWNAWNYENPLAENVK